MLLFSIDGECRLATALAAEIGRTLAPRELRRFEDGEHKLRPLVDPRGRDVYVVSSLYGTLEESPRDKLFLLLTFIATLRDHGAARVTAVLPYLAYARKDRRTQPFDPVTIRYVAQMFEAMGVHQLIVLEAHNVAALHNAMRVPVLHLEAHRIFGRVAEEMAGGAPLAVASPDPGGVKRALLWRESLEAQLARPVGFAMIDKRRTASLVSSARLVAGDVKGMEVLLLDDLVATGQTLVSAAAALRHAGALAVTAYAAHGLFIDPASEVLADAHIDKLVVTDSVPAFRLPAGGPVARKLRVVSVVPLLAQAINQCHEAWAR